jgi:3-phenylpropionate/trans-cinnamate dioxygenase ferredoxin reductase subunit
MALGVVVAGAGQAAGEFAFRLRQSGYEQPITLIGEESHLPYQRPPLSKAFLAGDVSSDSLLLRPQASYEKSRIDVVSNTRVDRIDRAARSLTLSTGAQQGYDTLVLATGGRVRPLTCPGSDLAGLFYLRTIADVDFLRHRLAAGTRLVIIGGGYVGLEVAAVAIKHGLDVTLIEAAPRLLARVAGLEISAFYEQAHRAAGVAIHTGAAVERLEEGEPGHVGHVVLADGRRFPADFVLAGIGLLPNVELAAEAGLKVDNGIWVDEYCRTEDHDILAIGDCSNHPSSFLGRRARLESVPNALEQARVAADTISGKMVPYGAIPWFWSDQYNLKLQAVGVSENYDQVVQRGSMEERAFTMFYLRQGIVIAADSVNRPADFMAAKRLVGQALPIPAADLADIGRPLKDLIPKPATAQ